MPGATRRDLAAAFTRALGIPTMKAAAARDRSAGADRPRHDSPVDAHRPPHRAHGAASTPSIEFDLLDGRLRLRRSSAPRSTRRMSMQA
jgi:hypothetical protein